LTGSILASDILGFTARDSGERGPFSHIGLLFPAIFASRFTFKTWKSAVFQKSHGFSVESSISAYFCHIDFHMTKLELILPLNGSSSNVCFYVKAEKANMGVDSPWNIRSSTRN
jgi:hypothetical protein